MKKLLFSVLFVLSFTAMAGEEEEKQIAKLMKEKDLVCQPQKKPRRIDPKYKGDDGYFRLTIGKKGLEVKDGGGSGYGFSNGGINDLIVRKDKIFLEVGDDGSQTLMFDFGQIGGSSEFKDNCSSSIFKNTFQ